ncbi:MAG: hypothetical protein EXS16_07270 [Gemmataceae bacterium]|nr:hypothetical protein [Gemmataceae bacterium]
MSDSKKSPPIVCICGSGKFWDEMARQRRRLTLEGKIVVGPEVKADNLPNADVTDSAAKPALDELHLRKIDLASEVLVVDIDTKAGGTPYTGPSTQNEIAYAERLGRPIVRLSVM